MNSFEFAGIQIVKSDIDLTKIEMKSGSNSKCRFECSLGIPADPTKGRIRCIVEVLIGENEPNGLKLYVKSICQFDIKGEVDQDTLHDDAENGCVNVALAETAQKIADLTEVLTGKPLNIPAPTI